MNTPTAYSGDVFTFIESSIFKRVLSVYFVRYRPNEFWMLTLYAKAKRENIPAQILKQLLEALEMGKKLTGKTLAKFEAERDVWQEVLDGVQEIKAGGGKRTKVEAKSLVARVRMKSGLSQAQFATALGVSKRTLEQWEQGRREPSGAAKQLLKIADRHPEVLLEVAA